MQRRPGSRLSVLFELHAASRAVGELLETAMALSPLTPSEYALYSILFDEGPHAPTELSRRLGMPATSMTHAARAMVERRHAERATTASDRRSYRLELTPAGLAAHAAASAAFAVADDRFGAELDADQDAVRAALQAITTAAVRA